MEKKKAAYGSTDVKVSVGALDGVDAELSTHKMDYACEFGCSLKVKSAEHIEKTNKARNKLLQASFFCFLFMCAKIAGGVVSNSFALLSDACYLLSDLAGFSISLFALV